MIQLRKALPTDAPILRLWDTQAHVMDSDSNDNWDWDYELNNEPDWRWQLMAEEDGRPVGIVQIIDPQLEQTHYWGACGPGLKAIDIWIGMPEDLNRGYGSQMMKQALDFCFDDSTTKEVWIDPLASNTSAIRFYQRLGFEFVEERTFGEDHCHVYRMTRTKWCAEKA